MQDLNDLYYFVQVVENKGFANAERITGIPKSRLSRRLAQLEKRLGVELLSRSTRHVGMTELGRAYYQHCVAMLAEAQAADELIQASHLEPCGTLRISCPPQLLHHVVSGMLVEFANKYPKVKLEIKPLGRRVELEKEGVDVAIRVRFPPDNKTDGLECHPLAESPQKLLTSPELLANLPMVATPDQLEDLPTLDWERLEDGWWFMHSDGTERRPSLKPRIITDDLSTLHRAALAGLGIVQLPMLLAFNDVAQGRLVEVLPEWQLPMGEVQAVLPPRRKLLPSVQALLVHLKLSFNEYDVDSIRD